MIVIALIYFWWILAKNPLHRYRTYVLPLTGMRIRVDRWRDRAWSVKDQPAHPDKIRW